MAGVNVERGDRAGQTPKSSLQRKRKTKSGKSPKRRIWIGPPSDDRIDLVIGGEEIIFQVMKHDRGDDKSFSLKSQEHQGRLNIDPRALT